MNSIYKNCICLVLDESGSMGGLREQVIKVFNKQIEHLKRSSQDMNQETRISVFTFNDTVKNIVFDVDVLRTPDISKLYMPRGSTALIDGTLKAIEDLRKIPELYSDFGFLTYVISDGQNNINNSKAALLEKTIKALPDNYTVAFLAPDASAKHEAQRFGFPVNNIKIWETTSQGLDDVGDVMIQATTSYMKARSIGVRSVKNLFTLDASSINTNAVKTTLAELSPSEYALLPVRKPAVIKPFVESWLKTYRVGSAYYQLVKPEIIQANKGICIKNKKNGKVYSGNNARQIIGLPSVEIKVNPITYGEHDIFVQSTSVNRNLPSGTELIVLI